MLANSYLLLVFEVFGFATAGISQEMIKEDNDTIHDLSLLKWETLCKLQPNGHNCGEHGVTRKFYYDIKMQDCKTADIGKKCANNLNQFDTVTLCHENCQEFGLHKIRHKLAPGIFCRLQHDFGGCNEYHPRFYFDVTSKQCKGFAYSGCGGNANRFSSFQLCSAICMPAVNRDMVVSDKEN
ncbi:hypothetical protein O0L34_g2488 [Tuta absoluta]|nr:hypothetical protein O0L34_g2488 [Tuta absoluta]